MVATCCQILKLQRCGGDRRAPDAYVQALAQRADLTTVLRAHGLWLLGSCSASWVSRAPRVSRSRLSIGVGRQRFMAPSCSP
eukprot:4113943-Pyramimonas_sp.AAC.1